jgi:uncharacterized protein YcfL
MKKALILLVISTFFIFVGCNTSNEANIEQTEELIKETELKSNEPTSSTDISIESNDEEEKVQTIKSFQIVVDALSFIPESYYYNDDGELVVTGYVHNDLENMVAEIRVKKLEIYNENDEMIASNCFGYIDEKAQFKPDESFKYTYTFPAMTVLIKDDDLNNIKAILKTSSAEVTKN